MKKDSKKFDAGMLASRTYVSVKSHLRTTNERLWTWRVARLRNLNRRTRILIVSAMVFSFFIYIEIVRPPATFPSNQLVRITSGHDLDQIALDLKEKRVVRSSRWLKILVRARGSENSVQAGDYLFKYPRNIFSVARVISVGAFGLDPTNITIHEGATIADMAAIFDRHLLAFDPTNFLLEALELEGYLFPDTYHFLPNTSQEEVIAVMRDNFEKHLAQFFPRLVESERSLHEVVIMASLVEKEARNERDRRLIAGVLWNRLDRGMLLQVDATFVYTHGKGTYGITLEELRDDSNPYNTYVYKGLPPGPIASPGESSLSAAINPIESDYLFYLADRKGTTYYSETYEEHLTKKRKYVD